MVRLRGMPGKRTPAKTIDQEPRAGKTSPPARVSVQTSRNPRARHRSAPYYSTRPEHARGSAYFHLCARFQTAQRLLDGDGTERSRNERTIVARLRRYRERASEREREKENEQASKQANERARARARVLSLFPERSRHGRLRSRVINFTGPFPNGPRMPRWENVRDDGTDERAA